MFLVSRSRPVHKVVYLTADYLDNLGSLTSDSPTERRSLLRYQHRATGGRHTCTLASHSIIKQVVATETALKVRS
jgi:hypothetical protein